MGVIGTRVTPILEQSVRTHCRGLGKTPSVWLRELIEKEISGRTPNLAVGDAITQLSQSISDNAKVMSGILAVSLSACNILVRSEVSNRPETAEQLERTHSEFVTELLKDLPLKERLSVETGVRISDVATEIERIGAKKRIQQEEQHG